MAVAARLSDEPDGRPACVADLIRSRITGTSLEVACARGQDGYGAAGELPAPDPGEQVGVKEAGPRNYSSGSLRRWVQQTEADGGIRHGRTTEEIGEIERPTVLKSASAIFEEFGRPNRS